MWPQVEMILIFIPTWPVVRFCWFRGSRESFRAAEGINPKQKAHVSVDTKVWVWNIGYRKHLKLGGTLVPKSFITPGLWKLHERSFLSCIIRAVLKLHNPNVVRVKTYFLCKVLTGRRVGDVSTCFIRFPPTQPTSLTARRCLHVQKLM